ncbi:MAG TPA: amino acid adenylation domain-containing protein [Myxococcaceae bacterium]
MLRQPERGAYVFLAGGETPSEPLTYAELGRRTRALGSAVAEAASPGTLVVLALPPGLDFVAAFLGCLAGGGVAVPVYPPRAGRAAKANQRFLQVLADARPGLGITTAAIRPEIEALAREVPALRALRWLIADEPLGPDPGSWPRTRGDPGALALLQYTSGSTGEPKGVMLTHANLVHNSRLIQRSFGHTPESRGVIWLPPYHDMGLIGGILQPLYAGFPVTLMSPMAFLQRPQRWLEAISRFRATTSGGPGFAYDLCARAVDREQRARIDLSSWEVAFNGAEPVRAATIDRFAAAFEPCGFRRSAFYPCYGLAEATLIVSGGTKGSLPVSCLVDASALEQGRAVAASAGAARSRTLVGVGEPLGGQEVLVVDPVSRLPRAQGEVGEIWVAGPSVARGYLHRPGETEETFGARRADTGGGPYLRTGDLGFLGDGRLFVVDRLKDLVIIRGRNLHPHDLEQTIQASHPALNPGGTACFAIEMEGEERLAAAVEVERRWRPGPEGGLEELAAAIRSAVAIEHEIQVHAIALVKAGTLPRTTSGKLQRYACRRAFLAEALTAIGSSVLEASGAEHAALPPDVALTRERLVSTPAAERRALLDRYLRTVLAQALERTHERVDAGRSFAAQGLDSLKATALAHRLERELGIAESASRLLECEGLEALSTLLLDRLHADASRSPAAAVDAPGDHALTVGQRALWYLQQLAPESAAYGVHAAIRIESALDHGALRRAAQALVDRHHSLRTTFHARGGEPYQRIHPTAPVDLTEVDASTWSAGELEARVTDAAHRPFDLERGPIVRLALFSRGEREHVLLFSAHHIALDLWSLAVLLEELGALYPAECSGRSAALPAPVTTVAALASAQAAWLDGPEAERHWSYWREQLADLQPLALPADRPRPAVRSHRGVAHRFALRADLTARLRALAAREGTTLFAVLLAGFQLLLSRYSGQRDVTVGAPIAGRSRADRDRLVGYLVNPVPLRARIDPHATFSTAISQARRSLLEAIEHQEYPFATMAERLRLPRDPGRAPGFQVMLVLEQAQAAGRPLAALVLGHGAARVELGGLVLSPFSVEPRAIQMDLTLTLVEDGDALGGVLQMDADLFEPATAARVADHLEALLTAAATEPDAPISRLQWLSDSERRELVARSAGPGAARPEACAHHLFAAQARRTPDAVALELDGAQLTYGQLHRRAHQLAHHLRALGVGPETIVGICAERSFDLVAGILGVLEAGAAYLPLDPSYPPDRLALMVREAAPPLVLAQEGMESLLPPEVRKVRLDAEGPEGPLPDGSPDGLAYVIYTSGSTGRPKGTLLTHRGLCDIALTAIEALELGPGSRVLQAAALGFDTSVWEMFSTLLSGGTLCLARREELAPGPELRALLERQGITTLTATPSLLAHTPADGLPALRTVVSGGEVCTPELASRWKPGRRMLNAYGPTEVTVCCTLDRDVEPAFPTLGRPLPNEQVYVLDGRLEPAPWGVPGELYIGGLGVARGYLKRPGLTAERFVPDPFGGKPGARLYRTGDVGRYLPDGRLEFLGRGDNQVKLRGYRIELGEIEAHLAQHPAVRLAAATVHARGAERVLVGYVALHPGASSGPPELRDHLRRRLPEHMVPSHLVTLDALPLGPAGKVDRGALPPPPARDVAATGLAPPRTATEELLVRIWSEVLGHDQVGIHDHFFEDLGGTSISVVRAHGRLRDALRRELPITRFFEHPSIHALGASLDGEPAAAPEDAQRMHQARAEDRKSALQRARRRGGRQDD